MEPAGRFPKPGRRIIRQSSKSCKMGAPLLQELSALTGGKFELKPDEILRPGLAAASSRRELAVWLLAAALLLWPVDIWLRRREWSEGHGNSLSAFSQAN